MRYIRTISILIIYTFLLAACGRDAEKALNREAKEIDTFLTGFVNEIRQYRDSYQTALEHPNPALKPKYDPIRYKFFENTLLYHPQEGALASIFATGSVKVGEAQWERIHILENLEVEQKKIVDTHSDFVKSAFLYFVDGVVSSYPSYNVVAFIHPGFDFRTFAPATFKKLEIAENPERSPIYGPPYIDMTGKGYLFTLRTPIDVQGKWAGYLGVDLDIGYISRNFVEKANRRLLILTDKGLLLSASKNAAETIGFKKYDTIVYLKQVPTADVPLQFDLFKSQDLEISSLAKRIVIGENFKCDIKGKHHSVLVTKIDTAEWLFAEIR